jgi:hypothetical protein
MVVGLLVAQSAFIKNAPALVEFFKNEAANVEIPLFGSSRPQLSRIAGKMASQI